jgi:hypothetical protein
MILDAAKLIAFTAAAAAALLGGCASSTPHEQTPRATTVDAAGRSWAVVFPMPEVADRQGGVDAAAFPEYARRDDLMVIRPIGPLLASEQWPVAERDSLSNPRRVYINTRADELLFFERDSLYRTRYYWGDRYGR